MVPKPLSLLSLAVLTVTTVALHTLTPITELSEVIPGAPKRRSAPGQEVFDPHNEFTFHYAKSGKKDIYIANFTVKAHGDEEAIIPIETFNDRLESIGCDEQSVTLKFKSTDAYKYAAKVWDWVNQHENHTFILVPKAGQCNTDNTRDPFLVTDIDFLEENLSVELAATRQSWEDAAPNFHIRTSHVQRRDSRNTRRDENDENNENGENNEDDDDDDEFIDDAIESAIKKIEGLDSELATANSSNSDNVFELQRDMDKAVVELYDLIEVKAISLLDDIEFAYGDEVSGPVDNVKNTYTSRHNEAREKFADAERLADTDPSSSWESWEFAVNLETQAIEGLWDGFDEIVQLGLGAVEAGDDDEGNFEEKRHNLRRGVEHKDLQKRIFIGPLITLITATVKGKGNIGIGIVKLLGVDKRPVQLSLNLPKWTPTAFGATKAQDGIDFSAGPEFEIGGKIIGEVEAEVKDKKPHIFRVTVRPEDVFAEVGFRITADGERAERLERNIISVEIPLKGAAFEIKGLIYVGPKLTAGVFAEILNMRAENAEFYVGTRATIPNESRLIIDGINKDNNKRRGWDIQQTQKGPEMTGEMNGRLAAWVSLRVSFEASILKNFGVEAGADARVPEIGLNFETTDDPDQACENSGSDPTAVHITSDISAAFHVFGGLKGQTPISVPLLSTNKFELFPPMCVSTTKA